METNNNFTTPDDGKMASIISYFTIIGWLIAYFAMHKDHKTELGSYQLRQTLLFAIVSTILGWGLNFILGIVFFAGGFGAMLYVMWLIQLALIIVWIVGFIGAINGEKKPIPFIGERAQTMFPNI